ncbi:toluene monooxygenase [Pusillimonas caeni]|uniref:toluene-4-monooxygenase system B family protein n=1 Tax=Pusillimonas caeni TaxID=1348472 RepID=UPI000E59B377|nr:toluene-4-monooxygenase system B family protein [Pusillimonas caeni]TFL13442.1 toluene monooxygenase [Pusillimonas caeni]
MSDTFALGCNYEGDYGLKMLYVSPDSTMKEVADIARQHIAGVFVAEPKPGVVLRVRRHGEEEFLPESLKVSEAGFIQMDTVDIIHVPAAQA